MKRDDIQEYFGKIVLIKLKDGFHYTAQITEINEDSIDIIDKFRLKHVLNISSIDSISEIEIIRRKNEV